MQHTSWRHWLQGVFSSGKPRPRRGARLSAAPRVAEVYEDRILLSASWGGGGGGGGWWGGRDFGRHDHGSAKAGSTSSSTPSGDHLVFTTQPTDGTAGQSFSVVVTIEDSSGNVVTGSNATIRLRINGPGRFGGDGHTMTATAVDGVATFNDLTLDRDGTYTLTAANWRDGYVTSDSFTTSADTSDDHLVFLHSDPRRGTADDTLKTIKVAVEDQFGNIVKSDDSTVTLTVKSGPTTSFDASTPSPETATVDNGIASFDNVILDDAGQYTLSATDSDSSTTGATSHEIHIRSS
jgi:hypothetical protein